jgi:hypothetical protein
MLAGMVAAIGTAVVGPASAAAALRSTRPDPEGVASPPAAPDEGVPVLLTVVEAAATAVAAAIARRSDEKASGAYGLDMTNAVRSTIAPW